MSVYFNSPTGRRLLKIFLILVMLVLAVWSYVYAYDRFQIVRLDNSYDPKYGFSVGYREQYFTRTFPSSSDIHTYLSDSTLLLSYPPSGNAVFYFDKNNGFIYWRDNTIEIGRWWSSPSLQIITLGDQWRIAIVYSFCTWLSGMPDRQDNCYYVTSLESFFSRGRGTRREYRKGNVFDLAGDKRAPSRLPNSEITIDSLLAVRPSGREN